MATASDLTLLLREIVTHPEDDTVRLAYADFVQEQGDETRAAFIRVQCRIAAVQRECGCGACVNRRGGGQHTNGPCAATRRQDDGVYLRRQEWELFDPELGYRLRDAHPFMRHTIVPGTHHGRTDACCLYSRGFISSLTASAEDFLRVCDSLIWHPDQTIPCPLQCVKGWHENSGSSGDWKCKACENGRVPREFPPTAQPITHVTLTTEPNEREFGTIKSFDHMARTVEYYRFPGVTFTIPSLTGTLIAPPEFGELMPLLRSPVAPPVPLASGVPQTGWHITRETNLEEWDDGGYRYPPLSGMWRRQPDTFTLTVRVPHEPGAAPPQPGTTLRDLIATDRAGREYRVPTAILTRYETHVLRRMYISPTDEVSLTATASSTPVPL